MLCFFQREVRKTILISARLCAPVLALCGPAKRCLGNARHARQRDRVPDVTRSRYGRICGMPERHLHECNKHRAFPLQRRHFRRSAEPLCAQMRFRTGGFGGCRRIAIATGASRHHDTDTTAPARALHLVMHKMHILLSRTTSMPPRTGNVRIATLHM